MTPTLLRFLLLLLVGPDDCSLASSGQDHPPRRAVTLDDADELGLALGLGLTSLFSNAFSATASTVRAVAETAGGVAGGSVKVLGGAVKGVAVAVTSVGESVGNAGGGGGGGGGGGFDGGGGGGGSSGGGSDAASIVLPAPSLEPSPKKKTAWRPGAGKNSKTLLSKAKGNRKTTRRGSATMLMDGDTMGEFEI